MWTQIRLHGQVAVGSVAHAQLSLVVGAPSPDLGKTTVPMVEAGSYHSMLLRPDGTVWTWGQGTSLVQSQVEVGARGHGHDPGQITIPGGTVCARGGASLHLNGESARRVINGTAAGPDQAGDTYNYLSHVVSLLLAPQAQTLPSSSRARLK